MIVVLFLLAIAFWVFYELYWKRRNFHPGPTPLPLIGNFLTVYWKEPGYEAFRDWQKQYGPVYTMWMGNNPLLILADYKSVKETIIKDAEKYSDRFVLEGLTNVMRGGNYGVIETSGDLWREQRRFTLHILRDFGMGKNGMEERVLVEVEAMFRRLDTQAEVQVSNEFDIAIGSIINNILFGYRYDDDKLEEFFKLKTALKKQLDQFVDPLVMLCIFVPFIRELPYFRGKWQAIGANFKTIFGYFAKQIEEREKNVILESDAPADFVDCFLREKHKRRNEVDFGGYSNLQLQSLIFDLWQAGLDTTSTIMTWMIALILNHPDVQKKLHEELDRVVGKDCQLVTLSEKNDLVYLNATINEVIRFANLLPINLNRLTNDETVIGGRKYPKGTIVIPQICCVLYDEEVFPDPYKFDPTRFIDENGKLKKIEEFIPFSAGKRQCIGEGIARMELFLFSANLLHRYEISSDVPPSLKKKSGSIMKPPPFTCKLGKRF